MRETALRVFGVCVLVVCLALPAAQSNAEKAAVAVAATVMPPAQSGIARRDLLLIGNSHFRGPNMGELVRDRLGQSGWLPPDADVQMIAHNGWHLRDFVEHAPVLRALNERRWHTIVLQEATAAFLTAEGRANFKASLAWFEARIGADTRIVLLQTWPWADGHWYYASGRGELRRASDLWAEMRRAYAEPFANARFIPAGVGGCWVQHPDRETFYSKDHNHASPVGSHYTAKLLSTTIQTGQTSTCH